MTGMEQYIIVYSKYIITLFMLLYCVLAFCRTFSAGWRGHKLDNIQGILIFLIQFIAFLTICVEKGDVDYLFFFIGRNEEYGSDAMRILSNIQEMIAAKRYPVKTVAASIKNLAQLEKLAAMKVDYAAIPYTLYMKSLEHPLTDSGARTFEDDFYLR